MLSITNTNWAGNTWLYQLPEYVVPTIDRGKLRIDKPEVDANGRRAVFSGRAVSPYPAEYCFTLCAGNNCVEMTACVTNLSDQQWNAMALCVLCLRFSDAPDFFDSDMSRTFVHTNGQFLAIADARSKKLHSTHILRTRDLDVIPEKNINRYYRNREFADCSLIVRSSGDDNRHVGLCWDDAAEVSYNLGPTLKCLHCEPRFGNLKPGESKTIKGKIYFFTGTRDQLYQQFLKDFPSKGYGN